MLLLFALGAGAAAAQGTGENQDAKMRKLLARLESLEAEVRQLKAGESAVARGAGKGVAMLAESQPIRGDEGAAHRRLPAARERHA